MGINDDAGLYCKVYVQGAADATALKALLAELTGGALQRRNVAAPPLDIDVFDRGRHVPAHAGTAFTQWPHYLEIAASPADTAPARFTAALAALLDALQGRGLEVRASCSFEEELALARRH